MRAKRWITNNIGLKLLALVLAITTWFYINKELAKIKNEEERAIFSMLNYNVISKKLPIQLTIVGKPQEGYEVLTEGITIDPVTCVVIGPQKILMDVSVARTIPIDISEYTKDITKHFSLAPIAKGISLRDYLIKVHIPVVKINRPKPE